MKAPAAKSKKKTKKKKTLFPSVKLTSPRGFAGIRRKWRRWLEELRREVGLALLDQELFWELQAMAQRNPGAISPSGLFEWMCRNHIQLLSLRVRRLVDHDSRTASLLRLLLSVYEYPSAIDRAFHASLYRGTPMGIEFGKGCFDRAVATRSGRLSLLEIRREVSRVQRLSRNIKVVVDKRIAHLDRRFSVRTRPTLRDLDAALAEIDRLVCRYSFLLTGSHWDTCKPTRQEDWRPRLLRGA